MTKAFPDADLKEVDNVVGVDFNGNNREFCATISFGENQKRLYKTWAEVLALVSSYLLAAFTP
jgi:hypothetical protein